MTSELISADEIKKELTGYSPEKAEEFHRESAKMADRQFDEKLKSTSSEIVVLMSGGPASGKTEFISEYLMNKDYLIFDGILPTEKGAEIKIRHIKKARKKITIYAVWPEDIKQAYVAFLHRDRKFSDRHFFEKHSSARKTLLWIAKTYPDLDIKIVKNTYFSGDLSFTELLFDSREELIAYLEENQYNIEDIIRLVTE